MSIILKPDKNREKISDQIVPRRTFRMNFKKEYIYSSRLLFEGEGIYISQWIFSQVETDDWAMVVHKRLSVT